MLNSIKKTAFYDHPPEKVWVALTDPRAIAEWLMPNDFRPVVGHRFTFQTDPMPWCTGHVDCEVLEVDPPRRLVYTWTPIPKRPEDTRPPPSKVIWNLSSQGAGTLLSFEHTGLERTFPFALRLMLRFGWGTMVKRWIPKVSGNVGTDGRFTPGAIPLEKRCYKCKTVPSHLIR